MDKKFVKICSAVSAAAVLLTWCGCSDGGKSEVSELTSQSQTSSAEAPSAQTLRRDIVGSWGRLGEVMHEFYSDNTCIVGAMFGDYEIEDDASLVLITTSGNRIEYVWGDFTQTNWWTLESDTLTVNGNQFSRIEETADEIIG